MLLGQGVGQKGKGVNVVKVKFELDEIVSIDYSEDLKSYILYHKCGAVTLIPV